MAEWKLLFVSLTTAAGGALQFLVFGLLCGAFEPKDGLDLSGAFALMFGVPSGSVLGLIVGLTIVSARRRPKRPSVFLTAWPCAGAILGAAGWLLYWAAVAGFDRVGMGFALVFGLPGGAILGIVVGSIFARLTRRPSEASSPPDSE